MNRKKPTKLEEKYLRSLLKNLEMAIALEKTSDILKGLKGNKQ